MQRNRPLDQALPRRPRDYDETAPAEPHATVCERKRPTADVALEMPAKQVAGVLRADLWLVAIAAFVGGFIVGVSIGLL